jgi:hypothetical protein
MFLAGLVDNCGKRGRIARQKFSLGIDDHFRYASAGRGDNDAAMSDGERRISGGESSKRGTPGRGRQSTALRRLHGPVSEALE